MPTQLEAMSRVELLKLAQRLNVTDADVMTRPELRSAIQNAEKPRKQAAEASLTWVGVARRLVASVIEQGLNLPEAASLVRGDSSLAEPPASAIPVATVTLARIYAAQGHVQKAIDTLQNVIDSEPDHDPARELCGRLREKLAKTRLASSPATPPTLSSGVSDPTPEIAAKPASSTTPAVMPAQSATGSKPVAPQPSKTSPKVGNSSPVRAETSPQAAAVEPAAVKPAPKQTALRGLPLRTRASYPLVLLVRTEDSELFAYWEAAPKQESQLLLVAHGVENAEGNREERVFPVYSASGAMELTGIEPHWVVRAMLRSGSKAQAGAVLAVASCIVSEGASRPGAIDVEFSPYAEAMPKEVALRAATYLATAPVNAW